MCGVSTGFPVEERREACVHRGVSTFPVLAFLFQGWIPILVTPRVKCCRNDLIRYSLCKYLGLPADFHWLYENASQMEADKLMRNANTSWFKWVQSRAVPLWLMRMTDCREQVTFCGALGGESALNIISTQPHWGLLRYSSFPKRSNRLLGKKQKTQMMNERHPKVATRCLASKHFAHLIVVTLLAPASSQKLWVPDTI